MAEWLHSANTNSPSPPVRNRGLQSQCHLSHPFTWSQFYFHSIESVKKSKIMSTICSFPILRTAPATITCLYPNPIYCPKRNSHPWGWHITLLNLGTRYNQRDNLAQAGNTPKLASMHTRTVTPLCPTQAPLCQSCKQLWKSSQIPLVSI